MQHIHDHGVGDDQHDGGEHVGGNQDLGHDVAQLGEEADDTIGGQGGDKGGDDRGTQGNDQAVFDVDGKFQGKQDGFEVFQCPVNGQEGGGMGQHLPAGFEGRDQQPQQGEHRDDGQHDQIDIGKQPPGENFSVYSS